ncbi:MAG TPA: rhodanese-like domain-containing protein [Candidatus Peribacterales bacterium]|nr:rhodanese-like domain-containing protein [Candidatus Peribacterales bacterium]
MFDANPAKITITASYAFFPLTQAEIVALQQELKIFGNERGMKGLVLIAPEGINSTVCGTTDAIAEWKVRMRILKNDIVFKDSHAERLVFRRWSVKMKPELITLKQPGIEPTGKHHHLTPHEWKRMMERDDVVIVDTRNWFEVAIGKFRNAIDPTIRCFQDFPDAIKASSIPKEKTVMLYCTGGIRCEKAVLTMEAQGYTNVYQLEGGILAYMEQYPHDAFEGECFVFDHRVALDQELQPSTTYHLCKQCGDPATKTACKSCTKKAEQADQLVRRG